MKVPEVTMRNLAAIIVLVLVFTSSTPITRAGQSLVPDTEAAAAPTESGGMNPAPTAEGAASSAPTTTTPLRVVTRAKALDTSTPVAGVRTISSIEAAPISVR